jgi:hypothetical protein
MRKSVKWLLGLLFFILLLQISAYCEQRDNLFVPDGNDCDHFLAGLIKITSAESLSSYDTTIIAKARLMACASFIADNRPIEISELSLNCIIRLNDLDSLVILKFGALISIYDRVIIYDPQSGYLNESYGMNIAGLDYLIMEHNDNALYNDKIFLTRLYFMLHYAINYSKYFLSEVNTLANIWQRPGAQELVDEIIKYMTSLEKESTISDYAYVTTIVETSVFISDIDGDSIEKISAKFRGNYLEDFKVENIDRFK